MQITTQETYKSFTQFRKSKERFERMGFECPDITVTKSGGKMKIVAKYCKKDGTIEDIALI